MYVNTKGCSLFTYLFTLSTYLKKVTGVTKKKYPELFAYIFLSFFFLHFTLREHSRPSNEAGLRGNLKKSKFIIILLYRKFIDVDTRYACLL